MQSTLWPSKYRVSLEIKGWRSYNRFVFESQPVIITLWNLWWLGSWVRPLPSSFPAGGKSKSVELEDVKFHQCVRLTRFDNDRTISFVPPDGEFELMSYRLNTHVSIPFHCSLTSRHFYFLKIIHSVNFLTFYYLRLWPYPWIQLSTF